MSKNKPFDKFIANAASVSHRSDQMPVIGPDDEISRKLNALKLEYEELLESAKEAATSEELGCDEGLNNDLETIYEMY